MQIITFLASFLLCFPTNAKIQQGAGIDIIQGKSITTISVFGNNCGKATIKVLNENDIVLAESQLFNNDFVWTFSTDKGKNHTLKVVLSAENQACIIDKIIFPHPR